MVRLDAKPSRLAASCCRVLVMNGGAGRRRRCFLCTAVTTKGFPFTAFTTARASFSECSSSFLPSILCSFAPKRFRFASSSASIDQYSCGLNSRIACSRSTMILSATVWTRPAERPAFTERHSSGLTL